MRKDVFPQIQGVNCPSCESDHIHTSEFLEGAMICESCRHIWRGDEKLVYPWWAWVLVGLIAGIIMVVLP